MSEGESKVAHPVVLGGPLHTTGAWAYKGTRDRNADENVT